MLPDRWMTGTQSHEGIAGTWRRSNIWPSWDAASIPRGRAARRSAHGGLRPQSTSTKPCWPRELLVGPGRVPGVTVWGIPRHRPIARARADRGRSRHAELSPHEVAERLAEQGIFVWHGNFYALPLTEALGLEPEGVVRIGLLHYNTTGEVDRLLAALAELES